MIIKKLEDVKTKYIPDIKVSKSVVIGSNDESNEVILRYLCVEEGGATPRHQHDFPHLVKVEKGEGIYVDEAGKKHKLVPGNYVFVPENELHNFQNEKKENFEFICIVPERGEF